MHAFEFNWIKIFLSIPNFPRSFARKRKITFLSSLICRIFRIVPKVCSKNEIKGKLLGSSLIDRLLSTIFGLFRNLYIRIDISLSLRAGTRVYSTYRCRSVIIVINGISNVCARY